MPDPLVQLHDGDLSAAAAIIRVRAQTAGAAQPAYQALAARLQAAANDMPTPTQEEK